jgi:hypothetical protein
MTPAQKRLAAPRLTAAAMAVLATILVGTAARYAPTQAKVQDSFAARIAALSEPGGYFNTDNLISNERSYLHVAPELRALAKQAAPGSTYLGVGPDQNFSYIGHLRPSMAIVIDIRRDNLLLHLLFKAIFAEAKTRADYLALLTGRTPANPEADWPHQPIEAIVRAIDTGPAARREPHRARARAPDARGRRLRRAAVRRRPRDHRRVPPALHRRRPVAAVQHGRPRAAVRLPDRIAICCSSATSPARARASSPPRTTFSSSRTSRRATS